MRTTLSEDALAIYLSKQISCFFPDRDVSSTELRPFINNGLERLAFCFSKISDKYLPPGQEKIFNQRNTDHYAMFLYFVANSIYRMHGSRELAAKTYALNKALHAIDVYYEVALPEVFFFQHPMGTVLGRAQYGNYFVVYQRCTVGAKDQVYPTIGEGVVMFGGSAIIGSCAIGGNVWLSSGAKIIGHDIPHNSTVFGQSPYLTIKPTKRNVINDIFNHPSGRQGAPRADA